MNTFILAGNLTKDPVLTTVNGADGPVSKCTFVIAVRRSHNTSSSDNADFFPCTAWRKDAEHIASYFKKGRKILVSGHMKSKKFEDASGSSRMGFDWYVDQWEFCDSSKGGSEDTVAISDEMDTGTFVEPAVAPPVVNGVNNTPYTDELPF